jgi:phosphoserine phosphatase RsbU/P
LPCTDGCWIGIGDVAGHGLPAGLVMLMIQSIVAATVYGRPDLEPREAWRGLNAVLSDNIRERMRQQEHATLCLIRYDGSGRLRFAGAHESLLIYRKNTGRAECVPTTGIWAGIIRDVPLDSIDELECRLGAGDVLLLHTDGVVEAMSSAGEPYGLERLQALLEATGELPVQAICERILADVGAWMDAQSDDITLVVARHVGTA